MFHLSRLTLAASALALAMTVTTSPVAAALPDWQTSPASYTNDRARSPKVVDLRYARHGNFDRVVVDVRGRRPGYEVRYVKRLEYDGSGHKVPLRGKRKMQLTLNPAVAHNDAGNSVYDGPRLRQLKFPTLRGVALTGDFESYVSFGFTTDRRAPFRVFTLTNPSRIVIDFRH